jgi:hypothetical protein
MPIPARVSSFSTARSRVVGGSARGTEIFAENFQKAMEYLDYHSPAA